MRRSTVCIIYCHEEVKNTAYLVSPWLAVRTLYTIALVHKAAACDCKRHDILKPMKQQYLCSALKMSNILAYLFIILTLSMVYSNYN